MPTTASAIAHPKTEPRRFGRDDGAAEGSAAGVAGASLPVHGSRSLELRTTVACSASPGVRVEVSASVFGGTVKRSLSLSSWASALRTSEIIAPVCS
jgi:hypothetical protein